jgi:ferredoxin
MSEREQEIRDERKGQREHIDNCPACTQALKDHPDKIDFLLQLIDQLRADIAYRDSAIQMVPDIESLETIAALTAERDQLRERLEATLQILAEYPDDDALQIQAGSIRAALASVSMEGKCTCCGQPLPCDECGPFTDSSKTQLDDPCKRCGRCINHCPHQ